MLVPHSLPEYVYCVLWANSIEEKVYLTCALHTFQIVYTKRACQRQYRRVLLSMNFWLLFSLEDCKNTCHWRMQGRKLGTQSPLLRSICFNFMQFSGEMAFRLMFSVWKILDPALNVCIFHCWTQYLNATQTQQETDLTSAVSSSPRSFLCELWGVKTLVFPQLFKPSLCFLKLFKQKASSSSHPPSSVEILKRKKLFLQTLFRQKSVG